MRRVEIAVRVRPSDSNDICTSLDVRKKVVRVSDETGLYAAACPRYFSEDVLFDHGCSNKEVFERLILEKMRHATPAKPDTLCFLAYGHTSSGKTHTITGSEREAGVLTLCVEELLRREGVVEVAMLEVYMESVNDLLAEGTPRRLRRRTPENGKGDAALIVENLTTCTLSSVEQWLSVSQFGMRSRRTAATERNERSSRSHALFTIKTNGVRVCLVDLAGSERQTVFSPQLNKESISINKSLSRLSTVLEALSTQKINEDGTRSFVNFRDTTLTILLQRYLTGASQTTFLACVHPAIAFYQETLSTLRYTQRLKKIRTRVSKPGDDDISMLQPREHQALLDELQALRDRLRTNQDRSLVVEQEQRKRIEELERMLSSRTAAGGGPKDSHRARDTKRVAGWLLSRILGDLPQLNVGYDDYFDSVVPEGIQIIGYVSTMACLPPRESGEDENLAFLDVGDFAMGLSMVDAGIPPQVPLHCGRCQTYSEWEGYSYNDGGETVYALAFFDVGFLRTSGDVDDGAFLECCGGIMSSEPMLPIATVLCVRAEASVDVKEGVLQRLISLQGQQEEAFELRFNNEAHGISGPADHSGARVPATDRGDTTMTTLDGGRESAAGAEEEEVDEESGAASSHASDALARELHRQAHSTGVIPSPFLDDPDIDLDSHESELVPRASPGDEHDVDAATEEDSDGKPVLAVDDVVLSTAAQPCVYPVQPPPLEQWQQGDDHRPPASIPASATAQQHQQQPKWNAKMIPDTHTGEGAVGSTTGTNQTSQQDPIKFAATGSERKPQRANNKRSNNRKARESDPMDEEEKRNGVVKFQSCQGCIVT